MGSAASLQSNVTNINNSLTNRIKQEAITSADTKCTIEIENISFKRTNGCALRLVNQCYSNAQASMKLVSEVLAEFYNKLDNTQKQEAASWFTLTVGVSSNVNNVVNNFENYLTQTCNSRAETENTIKTKNVIIEDCTAPPGQILNMEFINMGQSQGICAMEIFNNIVATASSDIANKQSQGLDWSKLIWPIIIAVCVIAIIYLIVTLIVKKLPSNAERLEIEKNKKENYANRIKDMLSYLKTEY
ncbi:putative IMV membrane protein [Yalta virus]|nr:putative IMV membrane protein [Yalta virus]